MLSIRQAQEPRHFAAIALRFRVFAAFALCLLVGQHTLPGLHHAALSHRVCAEHGDLIHAGEVHGETDQHGSGLGVSEGSGHGEHGHCGVVPGLSHDRQSLPAPRAIDVAPAELTKVSSVEGRTAVVAAFALFRLAPKQSPPA